MEPVSFVVNFCKADHDTVLEEIEKMLLIRWMNFYWYIIISLHYENKLTKNIRPTDI